MFAGFVTIKYLIYPQINENISMDTNYTNVKLASELDSSLKNLVSGIITNTDIATENNGSETARSIKERAMKTKVEGMKHLIGVTDRSPTKPASSQKSAIKTPVKTKGRSPKKSVQQNLKKKPARPQKRKRKDSSDSMDDVQNDTDDVHNLDKTKPVQQVVGDEIQIDSQNIKFEQLPSLMKCNADGRACEIEVIDEIGQPSSNSKSTRIKRTINSKREKRNLKKTLLKSRLKRMGIDISVPT